MLCIILVRLVYQRSLFRLQAPLYSPEPLPLHNHNWLSEQSSLVLRDVKTGQVTEVSEQICISYLYYFCCSEFGNRALRSNPDNNLYSVHSRMSHAQKPVLVFRVEWTSP